MLEKGAVIRSLAGRDKGCLLAVMQAEGRSVTVCDGKERPLNRPKSKNIRHIEPAGFALTESELASDRALRRALRRIDSELNGNT